MFINNGLHCRIDLFLKYRSCPGWLSICLLYLLGEGGQGNKLLVYLSEVLAPSGASWLLKHQGTEEAVAGYPRAHSHNFSLAPAP